MPIEQIRIAPPGFTGESALANDAPDVKTANTNPGAADGLLKALSGCANPHWWSRLRGDTNDKRQLQLTGARKSVVKQICIQATQEITDRNTRLAVRTQMYAPLNAMIEGMSDLYVSDQRRLRRQLRWLRNSCAVLALAITGLLVYTANAGF